MKTLIIGSGVSGLAVEEFLIKNNQEYAFVKQEDIDSSYFSDDYIDKLFKDVELIVVSPGVSLKIKLLQIAQKKKIQIVGELEFSCSRILNEYIAVTGTNGKTTTVNLLNYLLKDLSQGVCLAGNVGIPITSMINKLSGKELLILETSSFQLESIKNFKPHIAVVLNISEDHLNRHGTMKEYIRCKYKITQNQTEEDFLILNADDEIIKKHPPKTKAQVYYFSLKNKVIGSYIKNNCIYFNDNKKEIKLVSLSKIKLKGEHNLLNVLASVLVIYLKTQNLDFFQKLSSFTGVEHRLEFVSRICGVEFYNDSKATNILSTLAALKSFNKPIQLILGGSDKGYSFDELFKSMPVNVKNIAVFGETKNKIALSAKTTNYNNIYLCDDLESCVNTLFSLSSVGDILLLSPACASFDFFSNFEERGNVFKKIVREIEINESS